MTIPDWATTVSGILALLAAVWTVHRFVTKSLIREYLSELKPNGGTSMKDKVNSIESKVNKLESRIDQIYILLVAQKK